MSVSLYGLTVFSSQTPLSLFLFLFLFLSFSLSLSLSLARSLALSLSRSLARLLAFALPRPWKPARHTHSNCLSFAGRAVFTLFHYTSFLNIISLRSVYFICLSTHSLFGRANNGEVSLEFQNNGTPQSVSIASESGTKVPHVLNGARRQSHVSEIGRW